MPKTTYTSDIFLNRGEAFHGAVTKLTVKVRQEDHDLLHKTFPETGVPTYLTGLLYRILADKLRERGIVDYQTRLEHDDYINLTDLHKHLEDYE